ncbi:methylated-DNA--protein-cysteine methyltransferase [alpha proteobacterium U9-1i]|nr:methylated-DNA--protein-cysteine methyltransferase [alpha proteobacterium U9-1i]
MISAVHQSPVGELTLYSDGAALTGIEFEEPKYPLEPAPRGDDKIIAQARRELDAYFAGKLKAFGVALAPRGTPFQQQVWMALRKIPYGATRSYGQQAQAIGSPKASRAVGLANGKNPIPIIVPCHRVIGASGSLTGFGGGLERKKFLLDLEQGAVRLGC